MKENGPQERDDYPISIKLSDEEVIVIDKGCGIGLSADSTTGQSSLSHLLLPGMSSKYEEGQPDRHLNDAIGQFGQGFFSVLNFLTYHKLKRYQQMPSFVYNAQQELTLNVDAIDDKKQTPKKHLKDRITILSFNGNECLKIKLFNHEGNLLVDMKTASPVFGQKITPGTTMKIRSGLLKEIYSELQSSILKKFYLYEGFPIHLENEGKNLLISGKKDHLTYLKFDGGSIVYDGSSSTNEGIISICERGLFILSLKTEGEVPYEIALNCDDLQLTSERATVNFKTLIPALSRLIQGTIESSISLQEKALILNALYVIVAEEGLEDLLEQIKDFVDECDVFPDHTAIREMDLYQAVFFHPSYISSIKADLFYEQAEVNLYQTLVLSDVPFCLFTFKKKLIVFVNQRLFDCQDPLNCRFNIAWLNLVIEEKEGRKDLINVNQLIEFFFSTDLKEEESVDMEEISEEKVFPSLSLDQNMKICEIFYLDRVQKAPELIRKMLKAAALLSNPDSDYYVNETFLQQIISLLSTKKNLHILNQKGDLVDKFFPKLILKFIENSQYILKKDLQVIIDYLSTCEESCEELYLKFIVENISPKTLSKCEKNKITLHELFLKLRNLSLLAGRCRTERLNFFFKFYPKINQLDECKNLLNRISEIERRSKIFPILFYLNPKALNEFSDDQLNLLIDVISVDDIAKNKVALKKADYINILKSIASLPQLPLFVKEGWFELYYEARLLEGEPVSFNLKQLCEVLPSINFLKCKTETEFKENLKILKSTLERLRIDYMDDFFKYYAIFESFYKLETEALDHGEEALYPVEVAERLLRIKDDLERVTMRLYIDDILAIFEFKEKNEEESISDLFLQNWTTNNYISPDAPEMFIALCSRTTPRVIIDFNFPTTSGKAIPLETYSPLIRFCGNEKAAFNSIKGSLRQSLNEFFFLTELFKNALEAIAEQRKIKEIDGSISMEFFIDQQGKAVFIIRDNGKGMNEDELAALVTPNFSTKNKGDEDLEANINFGRGVFPSFLEFEEVFVQTCREGGRMLQCLLTRNESNHLFVEFEDFKGKENFPRGTALIYRKSLENPSIYLIKLQAVIHQFRIIEGVNITFNGEKINDRGIDTLLEQEEVCEVANKKTTVKVKLGAFASGLYVNQIKMSDIPIEYLSHIPDILKKIIAENGLQLSLFLPNIQQVMNRNQLINEQALINPIKRSVLLVAIKYGLKNLFELKSIWKNMSKDFLCKFTFFPLTDTQKKIIEFFKKQDWRCLGDLSDLQLRNQMIDQMRVSQNQNIEELINGLKQQEFNLNLERQLDLLVNELSQEDKCLFTLSLLPLEPGGLSIDEIRGIIARKMKEYSILDQSNKYNEITLKA